MKTFRLIKETAELQGFKPTDAQVKDIYIKTANQYIEGLIKRALPKEHKDAQK